MKLKRKLVIVSLLYFAEGFPFGLIEQNLPVYFRLHGMNLTDIGLLSLLTLPYALKFLWAPAVDFFGARRRWIAGSQFLMAAALLCFLPQDPESAGITLWICLFCLGIASATQDIAVDAYSIELLNTSEMGIANGFRQAAYRAAMLLSGSFFIALGGRLGWDFTYFVAAGVLAVCAVVSLRLPDIEIQRPKLSLFALLEPARELLLRHKLAQVTAFILLYKLGDFALGPMVRPFWLDKGLTTDQIGLITGTLGVIAAIAGGLTGGVFMARFGIFHGLWFLGLWQAVSNLSYLAVAYFPDSGPTAIYAASVAESFCGGLGTSAFLAYLMSICRKEYSATQYAVLSALFRVSGIIAGALSGAITGKIGYFQYFALSFFLSIPAFFFLIPAASWIPMEHKKPSSE